MKCVLKCNEVIKANTNYSWFQRFDLFGGGPLIGGLGFSLGFKRNIGALRSMSGTLTKRIMDPLRKTWFICDVSPVLPIVRVTSLSDKFMLSSFSINFPR